MKLYENVVIGNFLFALGFHTHRLIPPTGSLPVMINLLQQTPEDKNLGDVLLQFSRTVRLLEFKARAGRKQKEQERHRLLSVALTGENQHLQAVSRAVHWYLESDFQQQKGESAHLSECHFVPYLDAFIPSRPASTTLENIASAMVTEGTQASPCLDPRSIDSYLALVRQTVGSGETGAGGVIAVCDADGITFAELLDISDLRLTHAHWLKNHVRQSQRLEMAIGHLERTERTLQKSKGPGIGRGGIG